MIIKHNKRKKIGRIWTVSRNDLELAVHKSNSLADILRNIGFPSYSQNHYRSLKDRLKIELIDYKHIQLGRGGFQRNKKFSNRGLSEEEFRSLALKLNGEYSHQTVKHYIKKFNLLPYKCEECELLPKWNNKELRLQLDHKDGLCKNNNIENLRWLCPNCHSQTDTFGAKNIK